MFAQMAKLSNSNFFAEPQSGIYAPLRKKVNGEIPLKYRCIAHEFIHMLFCNPGLFLFYFFLENTNLENE